MNMANGTQTEGNDEIFSPRRFSRQYPKLGTGTLPSKVFTSQEQFEQEREKIFKKVWLNVGRADRIPEIGDYVVEEIAMWNSSIILVRSNDNEIRAFHNMCSHRGNKMAWDDGGNSKSFICKFHGWTYGLDGELRLVPDEEDFFDLNRCEAGLTPVACDVWEGFVFINYEEQPVESLEEYLGELATGLNGYPFAELMESGSAWTTDINANWKLTQNAFQEGYHINYVHKKTGAASFSSEENPHIHWENVQLHTRHARGSVNSYEPKRRNPSRPSVMGIAGKEGFLAYSKEYNESGERVVPPGLNPSGHPDWITDLNVCFPNFLMIVAENSVVTHNFWPLDVGRTRWIVCQYFPAAKNVRQRFSQNCGHATLKDIATEDGSTLEQAQSAIFSGAKKNLYLKDDEVIVRHHHNVVDQMLRGVPLQHPAN